MDKGTICLAILLSIVIAPIMFLFFIIVDIVDPISNHLQSIEIKQQDHEIRINRIEDEIYTLPQLKQEIIRVRKELEEIKKKSKGKQNGTITTLP